MPTTQLLQDKILARRVMLDGKSYGLSIVTICGDQVKIEPFEREVHSTRFVDGTLVITSGRPPIVSIQP
jgi:hypothetical protein